jgi:hypothetical protein
LCEDFDEALHRRQVFGMRRTLTIRTGIRAAAALAAVYALLFNALLSAAAPSMPVPSADLIICTHDSGGPDQPAAPSPAAHDNLCCVAVCGTNAAALLPSDDSQILHAWQSTLLAATPPLAFVAPKPPPNSDASPRGPPSLV